MLSDYKLGRTRAPAASRSTVLVVSLLVSLMSDQVSSLRGRGVSAAVLSSHEVSLVPKPPPLSKGLGTRLP